MNRSKCAQAAVFLLGLLLVISAGVSAAEPDLVILHTNDIHGRIETEEGLLGMARIASIVRDHRGRYDRVIVLDGGDTLHGKPIANQLKGASVVAVMNAAGYDGMTPGNHDFNFGYRRLLELQEMMDFSLISGNVFKDGELLFTPYIIKESGDLRIGIFGLTTPDTYQTTHPRNIEGIEFGNMIEAAETYVDLLRKEGVDLVIALGHVGFGRNYPSTDIIDAVDGIHLFVDGHSHDLLPEGRMHGNTLVVQANEYGKFLGRVEVFFREDGPELRASLISPSDAAEIVPDEEIEEMLAGFREEVRKQLLGL